jgi:hypothetical protein
VCGREDRHDESDVQHSAYYLQRGQRVQMTQ